MAEGRFSIRIAYDQIRPVGICRLSHQFVWHKLIRPNIFLFLWCFYHDALPLPEILSRFTTACPTRCLFCLLAEVTRVHFFMSCPKDPSSVIIIVNALTVHWCRGYLLVPTYYNGGYQLKRDHLEASFILLLRV